MIRMLKIALFISIGSYVLTGEPDPYKGSSNCIIRLQNYSNNAKAFSSNQEIDRVFELLRNQIENDSKTINVNSRPFTYNTMGCKPFTNTIVTFLASHILKDDSLKKTPFGDGYKCKVISIPNPFVIIRPDGRKDTLSSHYATLIETCKSEYVIDRLVGGGISTYEYWNSRLVPYKNREIKISIEEVAARLDIIEYCEYKSALRNSITYKWVNI